MFNQEGERNTITTARESMAKTIFTPEFYKEVYKEVYDYCKKYYESDGEPYGTMTASINVDGYDIKCEASIECEIQDESFDHAFGTWHDPYAGYYFSDVESISDVTVWDENGKVEGFSIEDYDAQFIDEEYNGIKKGDKVRMFVYGRYSEDTGEVLYYNNRTGEFCVKVGKFNKNFRRSFLKKVA